MFEDYYAARTLGTPIGQLDAEFADRVSDTQLTAIKRGEFKPFVPSENIEKAFAENARGIGEPNPYARAKGLLRRLIKLYDGLPLGAALIDTPNPFRTSGISQLPILQSQALQGLTQFTCKHRVYNSNTTNTSKSISIARATSFWYK